MIDMRAVELRPGSFVLSVGTHDISLTPRDLQEWQRDGCLFAARHFHKPHFAVAESDTDLIIYMGSELHANPHHASEFLGRPWNTERDNGASIRVSKDEGTVSIHSDFLGTEPVYYLKLSSSILISNRMENIAALTARQPDSAGVYQYMRGAYSVGSRTLFEGVRQNRPATTVTYTTRSGAITTSTAAWRKAPGSERASYEAVAARWIEVLDGMPRHALMLSAGWDSRLILMGPNVAATYTHGDLASREIQLAFQLAAPRRMPMTFAPLELSDYSVDRVREMTHNLGHAFFPHWYQAAQYMEEAGHGLLAAGLSVGHLSGHYGINGWSSGRQKLGNLARSLLLPTLLDKIDDPSAVQEIAPLFASGYSQQPWFLGSDWRERFGDAGETLRADVTDTLSGYSREGTTGIQEICERFGLEHQSRQYFAKQTMCALPFGGYHHPYGDSQLAEMVISIPYRYRVNYKLSRAIAARGDRSLFDYPMAATLVAAKRPILLQEASRLVRIAGERVAGLLPSSRPLRLGWNNFQFLQESSVFHEYIDSLRHPMWARDRMRQTVTHLAENGGNAFSMLDMFGRILTLDHHLSVTS